MSARTDTPFAPCAYCGNPAIVHPVNTTGMRCDYFQPMRPAAASPVSESEPPATTAFDVLSRHPDGSIRFAVSRLGDLSVAERTKLARMLVDDSAPAVSPSGGAPSDDYTDDQLRALVTAAGWLKQGGQTLVVSASVDVVAKLAAALLRERRELGEWKDTAFEYQRALDGIAAALGIDVWGIQTSQEPGDPPNVVRAVRAERAARLVAETRAEELAAALSQIVEATRVGRSDRSIGAIAATALASTPESKR